MKKLICFLVICLPLCKALQAQIVRPFAVRYNNPSVRGNIVYVSNSIITTSGTTGTGEAPPTGTSTNNSGAAAYIDIDNAPNTTLVSYGSSWKYWDLNSRPASWETVAFSDLLWPSGNGNFGWGNTTQTTCLNSGCLTSCPSPPGGCNSRTPAYYFRKVVNIPNPSLYTTIRLNLKRNDGVVIYLNGTEVGRDNMPAGVIAHGTFATAGIASGTAENYTLNIAASSFLTGNNTIAVEVHTDKAKASEINFDMEILGVPVDVSGTFSSSTADLSLASCSKVLWAGLYWGADQGTSGTNMTWMPGTETSIRLKIPGSSSFQTVTSQATGYHNSTSSSIAGFNHTGYTCFANITSLLNATSPNGTYTIADMVGPSGINNGCGGWTIVIAYENPSLVPRNLNVFDGHVIIDGGAPAQDITISGFLTPPSGAVSCELGGVALDGDRGSQDAFQFKETTAPTFFDLALTTSYALNGTADAWNSKISYKGAVVTTRNPSYNNTLGYDATIMDLPNTSNAQLGNSKSSAIVRLSSPSENYIVQVLSTSITQYNPEFVLTKSATDVNGSSLIGGDVLRYRIDYQNVGNDISTNSIVLDHIPTGSTYKPGTLVINGASSTDVSGDDQGEFDPANNQVVFRVGTGANASSGGQVAVSGTGYVQFDVYVPKSCSVLSCANPLSNSARINYVGNTSLASLYDSSGITVSGCFSLGPVINTVTGSCYTPRDTILLNSCPSTSATFPIQQYGGYQFYSAMPFTSGNAINPTATYSSSRIIYAYWNNGSCSDTVTIRIYITPCPDIDDDNDGIPDYVEANMAAALGDHDSDGVPNYSDAQYPGFADNNSDGVNDNFDPGADSDNDGTPNFIDPDFAGFTDTNGDGLNDNFDADLDGIPNNLDLDSDNDGLPDVAESFGVDANGDGRIDNYSDSDNDGLSQNVDGNNTGTTGSGSALGATDTEGDGIPNYLDLDSDNDGLPDVREAFGTDANNNGIIDSYSDSDGDGFSDNVDGDAGNDGVAENASNALLRTGADGNNDGRADSFPYKNVDGDTRPNPYDLDSDGDGINDVTESNLTDANNDGKVDGALNAKGWSSVVSALGSLILPNTDGSGNPNFYDIDSDDDGIPDNIEGLLTSSYAFPSGLDSDGDGIDNTYDDIIGFGGRGITPCNIDADAFPDYIDSDTDGDGALDIIEGNDFNFNGLADDLVTLTGADTDGDGLDNRFDANNASVEGTSAYMGTGGSFSGDGSPGSSTVVQRTVTIYDRDWRAVQYVLFLDFLDFRGALQQKKVNLRWTVQSAETIDHFLIERSTDRIAYSLVLKVEGHSGISGNDSYEAVDDISALSAKEVYYRLTAVSKDGRKKTGAGLRIRLDGAWTSKLMVIPSPVHSNAQILVNSLTNGNATFHLVDSYGRMLTSFTKSIQAGSNSFSFGEVNNLPAGSYYLKMSLKEIMQTYTFQIIR